MGLQLSSLDLKTTDALLATAKAKAWEIGEPWFLLDPNQMAQHRALWASPDEYVACISRQSGKSWWAVVECVALALRRPAASIKYAASTQKAVRAIIEPLLREILTSCPAHLQPAYNEQRGVWTWPNGSELTVAGVDGGHYENLRGTKAHLIVRDEAAFFAASDWDSIDAALGPQLLTTGGMSLMISTPPENPAHPFRQRFLAAQAAGRGIKRTLYDHPRLTEQERERFIAREASARGMSAEEFRASTYFRREYLCEFVTEESRAAIPGWNEERHRALVVERQRPAHFDGYVGLDFGLGDPHFVVLGYLDFVRATFVVEYEWTKSQANTKALADELKALEKTAWGSTLFEGTLLGAKDWGSDLPDLLKQAVSDRAPRQPYLRVGDNDSLVLADLIQLHGLAVLPTRKDNKALAVNELDMLIRAGRIEIHPRCTNLIRQLYTTVWNKARTDWERTGQDHGDGIDALAYVLRNVRWHKDPRPPPPRDPYLGVRKPTQSDQLKTAFGLKR